MLGRSVFMPEEKWYHHRTGSSIKPFGFFGIGVAATSISDLKLNDTVLVEGDEKTRPYINFGGDLKFALSPMMPSFFRQE
jgi:hypothetical protein